MERQPSRATFAPSDATTTGFTRTRSPSESVIVIKRSMNPGFAGIDTELYYDERTQMLFGDAKSAVGEITEEVKGL